MEVFKKGFIKVTKTFAPNSSVTWRLKMFEQLRFKFAALRNGIDNNEKRKTVLFNLRRNIHRLEKGLSYPNSREVFAEDYIGETVSLFIAGIESETLDEMTVSWAKDVLTLYFSVVADSAAIVKAKESFNRMVLPESSKNNIPYNSSFRPPLTVSYEDILQLSLRRRSVRYYLDKIVEEEVIKKAYDVAKYAPSACNRQAFQFLFFNQPEIVNKLSKIPGGVAGYSLPAVIVVLGRYDGYFDVRDINAPIIDSSLTIMSFLYAAETLGLGTVCINWPNLPDREENIRKVITIEPSEFVVMMIGVGYPLESGKIPYSGKRPNEHALLTNKRIKNKL